MDDHNFQDKEDEQGRPPVGERKRLEMELAEAARRLYHHAAPPEMLSLSIDNSHNGEILVLVGTPEGIRDHLVNLAGEMTPDRIDERQPVSFWKELGKELGVISPVEKRDDR